MASAKKSAAKTAKAGTAKTAKKEVIVGRLTDWPLGARLAKLMGIPASVMHVGCFQAVGRHGEAVSTKVFKVKETIPPSFAAFEARMHAALAVCAEHRAAETTTNEAFHANLSSEELAELLRGEYLVRSPAEALEARRLTPDQSLRKIEKALEKVSIGCPKKLLLEYLGGAEARGSLLESDPDGLRQLVVAHPEAYNDVDARLFRLWAQRAQDGEGPPMPPEAPELGFDRFGAYRAQLVAAGLDEDAASAYFLRKTPIEHARWWPSTGVWVWEQLASDPKKLLERMVVEANVDPFAGEVERAIAELLTAVLWLPEGALEAGALDMVKKVCASTALVPDATFERLRADDEFEPLLASVSRAGKARAPAWRTVRSRDGRPLIAD